VFWRAVGVGSVPFIPFIGATALYTAFIKILEQITYIWGFRGCSLLIKRSRVRNQFLRGCFGASASDIIGAKFLMALNIFGPLSAAQTATIVLKMIAGISLIYESIFWTSKNHPEWEITEGFVDSLVKEFQKSPGQQRMSNHLTVRIHLGNCYSKEACLQELQAAVEEGRSSMGKDFTRKHTILEHN
jgi:hypothetical protein